MKPRARRDDDLTVLASGDETLIYDHRSRRFHRLDAAAARLLRLCDGSRTEPELAVSLDVSIDSVRWTLDRLASAGLMDAAPTALSTADRRDVLRRMRNLAVASVPIVASLTAPAPAAAQSAAESAPAACPGGCPPGEVCSRFADSPPDLCSCRPQAIIDEFQGLIVPCS